MNGKFADQKNSFDNAPFDMTYTVAFNDVKCAYDNSILTVNEASQLQVWGTINFDIVNLDEIVLPHELMCCSL